MAQLAIFVSFIAFQSICLVFCTLKGCEEINVVLKDHAKHYIIMKSGGI